MARRGCPRASGAARAGAQAGSAVRRVARHLRLASVIGRVHTYQVLRSLAFRSSAHPGINVPVKCDVFDARAWAAMVSKKVRTLHLHTATIDLTQPRPRQRCTLLPLSARAAAHGTWFWQCRSVHDQLRRAGARRRSC